VVSTGSITVPNPYTPSQPSVFTDWKAHGAVDMRRAIAVSSNVYFYYIGGGYADQKGLGITKLDAQFDRFGFGKETGIRLPGELSGVVPSPEWKQTTFEDEWRLGDTYNTAIGQYGFQVTPLQMLRAYSAIANGGTLLTPLIVQGEKQEPIDLNIDPAYMKVVHEGMRLGAEEGTARALNRPEVHFAGKTGTAELGTRKEYVNSWVVGFYPYEDPKYAFVLLMEKGPRANLFGASPIMSQFVPWMIEHTPEFMPTLEI
jgi:penicillin-binding protein 2